MTCYHDEVLLKFRNPYSCKRLYSLKRTMDGTKGLFKKDEVVDMVDDLCDEIRMCKLQRKSFIKQLKERLDD